MPAIHLHRILARQLPHRLYAHEERRCRTRNDSLSSPCTSSSQAVLTETFATMTLIENKLIPIFTRGVASALLYGVEAEEDFDIPSPTPSGLSRPFTSVFEAQEACHELRNASILHLRNMGRKFLERNNPTIEGYRQQSNLLACHHTWWQNMKLLEQQIRLSKEEEVAVSALKASLLCTFIHISCDAEVIETAYDVHLERFKDIVHHGRLIIGSMVATSHAARFTFDISIIPHLYFVATRCRCPTTRREAVALLARKPPREGLWDAHQHVVVSNRAIEMEESEVDPATGWPAEETRLWSCVISAGMDHSGGFWATFLPARWVGVHDSKGRQKMLEEFFVL
ncbi:hypothetical protein EJ02DRAFT_495708 [Clathrospora elynae]|uniref:C6 zinc finger domain-containing protein n=1 Tax=Clathrospora elynae TaxID=706981 RepID=A0A6A5SK58_9PLEO|nr:hypothetical protein EJ02DRAFT_495708 [Clathrospora elynae]